MNETALLPLVQRGLVLCLAGVLPPLLGAALCGGLVDFVQGRFGLSEPAPAALARIVGGLLTLIIIAPWLGGEVTRFAMALWTMLPAFGS